MEPILASEQAARRVGNEKRFAEACIVVFAAAVACVRNVFWGNVAVVLLASSILTRALLVWRPAPQVLHATEDEGGRTYQPPVVQPGALAGWVGCRRRRRTPQGRARGPPPPPPPACAAGSSAGHDQV